MRRFITFFVLAATMGASAAHADDACFKREDLAWSPVVVRHFGWIDTAGKGCVTAQQIARFTVAMRDDRRGQQDRIRAAMASTGR